MSKFNVPKVRTAASAMSPIRSTGTARTAEGGQGFTRDAQSELFLLAVQNFVGEKTFYEAAGDRDARFRQLVHTVALGDPEWMARFIPWLRSEGNMRSAAVVAACETVKARLDAALRGEDVFVHDSFNAPGYNRKLIDAVCQRADEPGEVLAYWTSRYGRNVPKPVKRGVADAACRLYSGKTLIKYDSDAKGYRFADVLELTHAAPAANKAHWQGDLFKYAVDVRHHGSDAVVPESNTTLTAYRRLMATPVAQRRAVLAQPLAADIFSDAGMTWESLAGWLQGPMDGRAWEAIIPSMGYMALLRNLRNFDGAHVSDAVAVAVAARLSDPNEVARSRQLPFRFLSAYRAAPSDRWKWALEQALGHSLENIPRLTGRTLVLIDTSGSMDMGFSRDGTLMRWDAAALFGIALASRCDHADVVSFSNRALPFPSVKGESVLRSLERFRTGGFFQGGGTETAAALRSSFAAHDRVLILTDEQAFYDAHGVTGSISDTTPMHTFNLAGYRVGHTPSGSANRHTFGGLTDTCFRMIPLLEAGRNAVWPF